MSIQQALIYENGEKRLDIAKQFAMSAAHNIRENLKYYARHNKNELIRQSIDKITSLMLKEKVSLSVSDLILTEGQIQNIYYACLNDILPNDDFQFVKCTKRPPTDSLNSLISFGNTILYRKIANEIYKSRLDIRIGFLHSTNRRYESLNLDI